MGSETSCKGLPWGRSFRRTGLPGPGWGRLTWGSESQRPGPSGRPVARPGSAAATAAHRQLPMTRTLGRACLPHSLHLIYKDRFTLFIDMGVICQPGLDR